MCQTGRLSAPSLKRLSGNVLPLTLGLWLCSCVAVWLYGASPSALGHPKTGLDWEQDYVIPTPSGFVTLVPLAPPSSWLRSQHVLLQQCHCLNYQTSCSKIYQKTWNLREISTPLPKPTAAFTVSQIATSTATMYNNLEAQRCYGLPDMAKRQRRESC
jgi:hypothetical protein